MDIRQLEAFVAVMDTRSFSKAAVQLYLTQPTVSAHILSLEQELGVKLIIRTTKELRPSQAGEMFYPYAKQILQLRDKAIQAVGEFSREMKGGLTIAASTIPEQYFLPRVLQSFREKNPEVSFDVLQGDSAEVVAKVLSRNVELGFCGTKPESSKCISYAFADDSLVVITPNTEQYRRFLKYGFPLAQLTDAAFIHREKGSGTRQETELFLKELGVDPASLHTVVESRSTESILKMVREGMGIAIISAAAAEDYVHFQKILKFNFEAANLKRKLYLIRYRNGVLSPVAQAFCDFARKFYRKQT